MCRKREWWQRYSRFLTTILCHNICGLSRLLFISYLLSLCDLRGVIFFCNYTGNVPFQTKTHTLKLLSGWIAGNTVDNPRRTLQMSPTTKRLYLMRPLTESAYENTTVSLVIPLIISSVPTFFGVKSSRCRSNRPYRYSQCYRYIIVIVLRW